MTHMYTYAVPGTAKPGVHGPVRRANVPLGPELSIDGVVRTIYENFQRQVIRQPDADCIGWRPVKPDGTVCDFVWMSYKKVWDRSILLGSALERLGLCPANPDGMRLIGFYAKNKPEWVVGEQACYHTGCVPVPMYDTLGMESVEYVIDQCTLKTVCCTVQEIPVLVQVAEKHRQNKNPTPFDTALIMGGAAAHVAVPAELRERATNAGLKLFTFEELERKISAEKLQTPAKPPNPSDVAFFCYTSGTTGNPKGALITHEGIISCIGSIRKMGMDMLPTDVHLSYLPLPHVFERSVQLSVFWGGGKVGFYQGDTLKILEDIAALRPTIFPSVPRLLNRIYDKLIAGVNQAGGVKAKLFHAALRSKTAQLETGKDLSALRHPIWDRLVFNPLKARLGFDRLRLMVTGSAPIAPHVMSFLRAVFGVPVHEGYGQTESSTAISFTDAADFTVGHVGPPLPCNECRLDDVPEMAYLQTDTVHGADTAKGIKGIKCLGRGEIVVRGPNVFTGYYRLPEKTAEALGQDGWLHTGDIGLWTGDGKIKIIDRKKNIFKLSQGEYVAAEKIENVMVQSPLIAQCFIYGDSLRSTLIAIVVPDPENLLPWAKQKGIPGELADLCKDPRVNAAVLDGMTGLAKKAELKGFEIAKAVHLSPEPFSVENQLLTPTFKLKRNVARDLFRQQIDALYEAQENPKAKL